jgi:hypothetical protein
MGTDNKTTLVVTGSVCNNAASDDFSSSGAGAVEALPGCFEPRIEDFLYILEK